MSEFRQSSFELSGELSKMVDVQEEDSEAVIAFSRKRKVAMLAVIASYVPVRISPAEQSFAEIGTSEEFGIETVLSQMSENLEKNECEAYVLVNSPGGAIASSYLIAKALRETCKKLTIFIPHIAASGGTLVALTGDKIVMGRMSRLSPMDVQMGYRDTGVSANSMLRAFSAVTNYFKDKSVEEAPYPWKALADKLDPVIMQTWTDVQGAANDYVDEILEKAGYTSHEEIAHKLVYDYAYHGRVIDYAEAKELGLRVHRDSEDAEVWNIMRDWLAKYLLRSANKHFIRHTSPYSGNDSNKEKKEL